MSQDGREWNISDKKNIALPCKLSRSTLKLVSGAYKEEKFSALSGFELTVSTWNSESLR